MKPFKPGSTVVLKWHVPGGPLIDQPVEVLSFVNCGTKKQPAYRYQVSGGAWLDHDALESHQEESEVPR